MNQVPDAEEHLAKRPSPYPALCEDVLRQPRILLRVDFQ